MSDIDELRDRVVVVEDKVEELGDDSAVTRALAAMSDRDVAVFHLVMRGHTRVLNALRETQLEHGQTLAEHGQTLAEQGQTLAEQGQTLAEHSQTLAEHSQTLAEHSQTLAEHSQTLGSMRETQLAHGQTLVEQSQTLGSMRETLQTLAEGQSAMLQHLGITNHNGEQTHE
jgi:uncharacterized coiled-coil protein SlyX